MSLMRLLIASQNLGRPRRNVHLVRVHNHQPRIMSRRIYRQFKLNWLWLAQNFNKANGKPFNGVRTNCRFMRCQILPFEIVLNTLGTTHCTRHDKMYIKPRINKNCQNLYQNLKYLPILKSLLVLIFMAHCIFHIIYICLNNAHVRLKCQAINTKICIQRYIKKT